MPGRVAIQGGGLAACCCARLLGTQGVEIRFSEETRLTAPTLLMNSSTLNLLRDLFGPSEDFFGALAVIERRIVLWGEASEPTILPHYGVVVDEGALLQRLWADVQSHCPQSSFEAADFRIYSVPGASGGLQHAFGTRTATTLRVQLKTHEQHSCWIESVVDGWLFLIPCGGECGSLVAVGGPASTLLDQSRLIAQQIDVPSGATSSFPSYPRILDPLATSDWLACGSAAIGFDPICGEGAGNAVREAILACAVVRTLLDDRKQPGLVPHYGSRLLSGFLRHLEACRSFYDSCRGEWWEAELAHLLHGIAWTKEQLAQMPKASFRLVGFDLEPLG